MAKSALALSVAILCIIGITAGVSKALDVVDTYQSAMPDAGRLSARDQRAIDQLAAIIGVEPGSPRYHDAVTGGLAFQQTYLAYPIGTLLHVVPGTLLLLLAPLQFSARVRGQHVTFHRWSGRLLLVIVIITALSAFFFGLVTPYAGTVEAVAAVLFGGLFLFAGGRAWRAIRRRDVRRHREWMIRMFALALAVATIRVLFPILATASSASMRDLFGLSLWIGWPVTLVSAELWIRKTRHARDAAIKDASQQAAPAADSVPADR